jgi:hypothetical protein
MCAPSSCERVSLSLSLSLSLAHSLSLPARALLTLIALSVRAQMSTSLFISLSFFPGRIQTSFKQLFHSIFPSLNVCKRVFQPRAPPAAQSTRLIFINFISVANCLAGKMRGALTFLEKGHSLSRRYANGAISKVNCWPQFS